MSVAPGLPAASSAPAKRLSDIGLPDLSPMLSGLVDRALEPVSEFPDGTRFRRPLHQVTATMRAEAARVLPLIEALCAPPRPDILRRWLRLINLGVRNPAAQDAFDGRAGAVLAAIGDLPAGVFTSETLKMALREFVFWPAAAEMYRLLEPRARMLWTIRDVIAVAGRPAAPLPDEPAARDPRAPPTDAERSYVSSLLAGRKRSDDAAAAAPAPRPSLLTGPALTAFRQGAKPGTPIETSAPERHQP